MFDFVRPSLLWTLLPLVLFLGMVNGEEDAGDDEGEDEGDEGEDKEEDEGESEKPKKTSWRDNLEDDLKGHPIFEKYSSQYEANKALVKAQELIGKKGIIPPDENASKEDWDNFYKELGRPEKAEDYTLPEVEGLPEDLPIDETLQNDFKTWAHEAGLTQKQVNFIYEKYQQAMGAFFTGLEDAKTEQRNKAETNLRQKLGKAYDAKINIAKKLIKNATEEEKSFFEEHGNDPRLIGFLIRQAEWIGEDKLAGIPKTLTMTPEEAKAEILRIKGDPKHPFNIEDHPEREMARVHMDNLYKLAYPELAEKK